MCSWHPVGMWLSPRSPGLHTDGQAVSVQRLNQGPGMTSHCVWIFRLR